MFEYAEETERRTSVEREIGAPAAVIFDLLAEPSKHPLLDGSGTVLGSDEANPARLSAGARFKMSMKLGVPYKITNTVVEFDEGRRIAWRHLSGHRFIWELEPLGATRTRVRETFDWSRAHTPRLLEWLGFPERNRRGMAASLERLERLLALDAGGTAGDGGEPGRDGTGSGTVPMATGGAGESDAGRVGAGDGRGGGAARRADGERRGR